MSKQMRPIGCGALAVGVLVALGGFAMASVTADDATVRVVRGDVPPPRSEQPGMADPVLRAPPSPGLSRLILHPATLRAPSVTAQQGSWLRLTFERRHYVFDLGGIGAAWLFPTITGGAWLGRLLIHF
jgi:hypothetical protein